MESVRSQMTEFQKLKPVNFPKTIIYKKEIKLVLGDNNQMLLPCTSGNAPLFYFKGFIISQSKKSKKFELYYGKLYIIGSQSISQESTIYEGRFTENCIVGGVIKLKNASGVPEFIENEEKLQSMSKSAYDYATQRRTWENTIDETIDLYKNVI